MGTRQVKTLLEIADEECKSGGFQYIISLNQNVIDSLKTEKTASEHDKIINNNIILTLSDKFPEEKLLGIQVDLYYER